jgi:hypothetical protein
MPLVNYARDALVRHCLEVAKGDVELAVLTLDGVVRENKDFLVRYAIIPPGEQELSLSTSNFLSRFKPRVWVDTCLKRSVPGATYSQALARAYLLVPGLKIPETFWGSARFVADFETESKLVLQQRRPPRFNNFHLVRTDPNSGGILRGLEERIPREVRKYDDLYRELVDSINVGMPPLSTVKRLLGPGSWAEFRHTLAAVDALPESQQIDLDTAFDVGKKRRAPGWNVETCERALSRLGLYVTGKQNGAIDLVIGESYERYMNQQTRERNQRDSALIEQANVMGVWRIRRGDTDKWKGSLSEDEWSAYIRCDRVLRSSFPSGVLSRIPRRHFNPGSLEHMKTKNLPSLCQKMHVHPPLQRQNAPGLVNSPAFSGPV